MKNLLIKSVYEDVHDSISNHQISQVLFIARDSCIHQFLSITCDTCKIWIISKVLDTRQFLWLPILKLLRKSGIAETGETRHEGQCIQI